MIGYVVNLTRWEWFKLRRRWMPWILLLVLLLFSQLFVWGNFFSYRDIERTGGTVGFGAGGSGERTVELRATCNDLLEGRAPELPPGMDPSIIEQMRQNCQRIAGQQQEQLRETYASFTLPGSIANALGLAQGIGMILIAILTASTVGTEYGWATLRPVLAKGTGRWQFLVAKLVLIALIAAGALAVVAVVTVISSVVAGALAGDAPDAAASTTWSNAAIAFGKSWFALLPYVVLAGFITVVTTSSAAGMAVALGYFFGEQIAMAILLNLFDWFQTVADYVLGRNITAWMLGSQREGVRGVAFGAGIGGIGEFPGELHALLVMMAYMLALGGLTFWLFHRRDVAGPSGG